MDLIVMNALSAVMFMMKVLRKLNFRIYPMTGNVQRVGLEKINLEK